MAAVFRQLLGFRFVPTTKNSSLIYFKGLKMNLCLAILTMNLTSPTLRSSMQISIVRQNRGRYSSHATLPVTSSPYSKRRARGKLSGQLVKTEAPHEGDRGCYRWLMTKYTLTGVSKWTDYALCYIKKKSSGKDNIGFGGKKQSSKKRNREDDHELSVYEDGESSTNNKCRRVDHETVDTNAQEMQNNGTKTVYNQTQEMATPTTMMITSTEEEGATNIVPDHLDRT